MNLPAKLRVACAAALLMLSAAAPAQCKTLGGGCKNAGTPFCTSAPKVGNKVFKISGNFCPNGMVLTFIGPCATQAMSVPNLGTKCSGCTTFLDLNFGFLHFNHWPLTLPIPNYPPLKGITVCVQPVCILPPNGECLQIAQMLRVTVQ